jgi:hypothetical protein
VTNAGNNPGFASVGRFFVIVGFSAAYVSEADIDIPGECPLGSRIGIQLYG